MVVLIVLLGATLAAFWKVPGADFVMWDDDINIYRNPNHGGLSWNRIVWMITDIHYVVYYAPLSWLALSIIYEFCGLNPLGYHLASLLLHVANTLLVYSLIRHLLRRFCGHERALNLKFDVVPVGMPTPRSGSDFGSSLAIASGLGALLWSVHPFRVEAVAWATGISYLLAASFALLSLLFYLKSCESQSARRHWLLLSASVFAFLLGIISYPVVMAFPAALIILDLLVLQRFSRISEGFISRPAAGIWLEKLPFLLLSLGALGFTLYRRFHATDFWLPTVPLASFSISQRAAQAFYVWAYYLWKPLAPFALAPAYSNLASVHPVEPRFILSFVVVAGITVFLMLKWRRFRGLLALWLTYLCLLVPMLGLTEYPHSPSDRYNYLASVVISVAISAALVKVWPRPANRWISLGLCGIIAISCAQLTYQQTLVWQNTVALFHHLLRTFKGDDSRANIRWRLGRYYLNLLRFDEAETEFRLAIKLIPESAPAHTDLGVLLSATKRPDEAMKEFDTALAVDPAYGEARINKASLFLRDGKVSLAIQEYEAALRVNPNLVAGLNGLAWIRATAADPAHRKGDQALALALRGCQLTAFDDPTLLLTLAAAYAETGEFDSAIRTARQAAELASVRGPAQLPELAEQLAGSFRQGQAFHKTTTNDLVHERDQSSQRQAR